jgi:hypothetical protein
VKDKTSGEILVGKDQGLQTKYFEILILKENPRAKTEQRQELDDIVEHM